MKALFRGYWLFVNVTALALGALLVWWWQLSTQSTIEAKEKWIPDYYMSNATITQYDTDGSLSSDISATRFVHIREFGTTDMEQPRFNIYLGDDNKAWFGKADEGLILDSGAQINLLGNTLVTNGPDLLKPLSLNSPSLRIFPRQNYAESDEQVVLKGKFSHLTGIGMKLTLNNQRLLFNDQVTGTQFAPRN
jgi:lipopolysaccharide export system protein LptC